MWKIKDNVDLKELEKYGYRFGSWGLMGKCYLKELEYMDAIYITEDRNIIFDFEDVIDMEACINKTISDLIKSDLVEKV